MRQGEILLILWGVVAAAKVTGYNREQTKYAVEYEHKTQYVPLQELFNIEVDHKRNAWERAYLLS